MFTGTKEGQQTGGNYLRTGLSSFEFLGVNPTADQIKAWTGRDNVNEPDYSLTKDYNEKEVRPVNFWLKNKDGVVTNFRINVGKDDAIAGSGNYQVCTSTGAVVWAKSGGQLKPEFADHKPLRIGEADLITFVSKLINFDTKGTDNLYKQMTDQKTDLDSLVAGNYTGFANLAKWATEKEKHISMVMVVREKEALDASGNTVTKHYQGVCSAPETWFHGEVTQWTEDTLCKRYEKSLEIGVGQTKAYPLIREGELFTYSYQEFDKSKCVNVVADNPAGTSTWG